MLRREQVLDKITQQKGARSICKKLNPTNALLFGGKLGEVAKNLKDSGQLNPLAVTWKKPNKFQGNFKRSGYGGNYAGGPKGNDRKRFNNFGAGRKKFKSRFGKNKE